MAARIIARITAVFFALVILFASLVESSSIKYAFGAREEDDLRNSPDVVVPYALPHPGTILSNSPFWPAKVLRDRIELSATQGISEKASYELHLSDKRLSDGWELWTVEEQNDSLVTFQKAENYLTQSYVTLNSEEVLEEEHDKHEVLRQIAYASLKHREVLENVLSQCSDEARPVVTKILDTSKRVFDQSKAQMDGLGLDAPVNPFN